MKIHTELVKGIVSLYTQMPYLKWVLEVCSLLYSQCRRHKCVRLRVCCQCCGITVEDHACQLLDYAQFEGVGEDDGPCHCVEKNLAIKCVLVTSVDTIPFHAVIHVVCALCLSQGVSSSAGGGWEEGS